MFQTWWSFKIFSARFWGSGPGDRHPLPLGYELNRPFGDGANHFMRPSQGSASRFPPRLLRRKSRSAGGWVVVLTADRFRQITGWHSVWPGAFAAAADSRTAVNPLGPVV